MTPKHFLDIAAIDPGVLKEILARSHALKKDLSAKPLADRAVAMIFEKSSTRTRVSFERGIWQLGGQPIVMAAGDMQLGRSETPADTARVLSRLVDAIMIRANRHSDVQELAAHATVPVINGLTDRSHPCQIMADLQTVEEAVGTLQDLRMAWLGDGNNVCHSFIEAARAFNFHLSIATPAERKPDEEILAGAGNHASWSADPKIAAKGADIVVTDTWISMGDEGNKPALLSLLGPYQVDGALMSLAQPEARFLHCLPAYRGMEVTAQVIDGPQSLVFDEAENRLHAQKAILEWCLS